MSDNKEESYSMYPPTNTSNNNNGPMPPPQGNMPFSVYQAPMQMYSYPQSPYIYGQAPSYSFNMMNQNPMMYQNNSPNPNALGPQQHHHQHQQQQQHDMRMNKKKRNTNNNNNNMNGMMNPTMNNMNSKHHNNSNNNNSNNNVNNPSSYYQNYNSMKKNYQPSNNGPISSSISSNNNNNTTSNGAYDNYRFDMSKLSMKKTLEFPLFINTNQKDYAEARKKRREIQLKSFQATKQVRPIPEKEEITKSIGTTTDSKNILTLKENENTLKEKKLETPAPFKVAVAEEKQEDTAEEQQTVELTETKSDEKNKQTLEPQPSIEIRKEKAQQQIKEDTITPPKQENIEVEIVSEPKTKSQNQTTIDKPSTHKKEKHDKHDKQEKQTSKQLSSADTIKPSKEKSNVFKKEEKTEHKKKDKESRSKKDDVTSPSPSSSTVPSISRTGTPEPIKSTTSLSTIPSTPKLWAAVASGGISKSKQVSNTTGKSIASKTTIAINGETSSKNVHNDSNLRIPQRKDQKYIPSVTKGAESLGTIALRMCFDPDFTNYALETTSNNNTKDHKVPIKSIVSRGIVNVANICFMSSILQMLLSCKPFIDVLNVTSTRNLNSRVGPSSTKLLDACVALYSEFDKETFETEKNESSKITSSASSPSPVVPSSNDTRSSPPSSSSFSSSSSSSSSSSDDTMLTAPAPEISSASSSSPTNIEKGLGSKTPSTTRLLSATIKPSIVDAIKPDAFYKVLSTIPKFKDLQWGHQEDAEEFLTQLLDQLHEEIISAIECLTDNEIENLLQSITDEQLKIFIIRNLSRYNKAEFITKISPKLKELINKYGTMTDDTNDSGDSSNEWHEVSGTSKKGKKNKTAVKRTVDVTPSPISNIFGGQFRSVLDIPFNKESQSITLDPFQTIQLDISDPMINDLETAFKKFSEFELLPFKSSSGKDVEAKKQTFIDKLPQVLLIQLKRFSFVSNIGKDNGMTNYNSYNGRIEKIRKKINYNHELLVPVESVSSAILKNNESSRKYKLRAVVYHHGSSPDGGHYTADIYNKDLKKWFMIDDVNITELEDADVVNGGDNGLDTRTAYILMYEKEI
ncbi:mRNA-binding ubiquitin-specific protease UBP3 NDAI_0C05950 [Naumovozyma dairenensis CBS 421]|uniref:ubiquitinyl hydrolase 1 n=1 Tax=Naumovozyma dairenensis (strain ATCC 10597 / BCRC 20456 / CBS 421 / NBRC 0211 / NRRL Y-12639) TaxID=1071378 RepID=G0W8Z3_NAUDC|nr:hypothetical protein NDAI_0C05950 [Naumovozyma dairenensis CBS 421]CCD24254.1 hypothetical protein NDAI_0C05950 [Naumovozyma dairenensis CBS 421]